VFQGIFIFKDTSLQLQLGNLSTQVIPFYFEVSRFHRREIDVAYRYDLESESGRDAFHRAVLGSLVSSEDFSQADLGHPNPSVTRLYDRSTDHLAWTRSTGSKLSLFLSRRQDRSLDSIETEVRLPEGTKSLFRTASQKLTGHSYLFGDTEKTARRISLLMDKEGFKNGEPNSLLVIAENTIEDSSTTPRELNAYAREVGAFFNRSSLFPDFPNHTLVHPGRRRAHRAWYGRSSFYFGFTLGESLLEKWLNLDPEPILRFADTHHLDLDASGFSKLRNAFLNRDPITLYPILQRLLANRNQTEALMNLFKLHLPSESLENFLVAQNPAFGNLQQRGHRITELETQFKNTDPELGSGSPLFKSVQDPDARVDHLECVGLPDRKIRVKFNLSENPHFLFFALTPLTERYHRDAIELVVLNRGQKFHEGENEIILDPLSEDPLIHRLTSKWDEAEDHLSLTLGFSQNEDHWGYGSSCQFSLGPSRIPKKKL